MAQSFRTWGLSVACAALVSTSAVSAAAAPSPATPYDFNGNSYPELVIGAPGLTVGSAAEAGAVAVLTGSASGLSSSGRIISQSTSGVPGGSETGDNFGRAIASADFDSDGYADLAVGQPLESIGDAERVGAVTVVYGSASGLDATKRSAQISGPEVNVGGRFGSALVAGDFNRDGFPDLAVGAPSDDPEQPDESDLIASGTVTILSGGASGLSSTKPVTLRRQGFPNFDHQFGAHLAAGDLDADGGLDLVVASKGQEYVDEGFPGAVSYCLGRKGGPTECRRISGPDNLYAGLTALAVGNMSGDARPEIIVGSPSRGEDQPGRVYVLQLAGGTPLTVAKRLQLDQGGAGIPGSDEFDDRFGQSLAVGRLNSDGYADLVVGANGEDGFAGRVTVVFGASSGWRTSGNYAFDQNGEGIPGSAEPSDAFGTAVTLLDHNRDGYLDLTVGSPGENSSGMTTTVFGRSSGRFATIGVRSVTLRSLGSAAPTYSFFGGVLGR